MLSEVRKFKVWFTDLNSNSVFRYLLFDMSAVCIQ